MLPAPPARSLGGVAFLRVDNGVRASRVMLFLRTLDITFIGARSLPEFFHESVHSFSPSLYAEPRPASMACELGPLFRAQERPKLQSIQAAIIAVRGGQRSRYRGKLPGSEPDRCTFSIGDKA